MDFFVESLESRQLLAGSVFGDVTGSQLTLYGDAEANDVVLSAPGGQLQVASGSNATDVSVDGDLSRVRSIKVVTDGGADTIRIEEVELRGSLAITNASGSLDISFLDANVGGKILLQSDNADSAVVFDHGTEVRGRVDIRLAGVGTRSLDIGDAHLHRGLKYVSEGGDVTTRLFSAAEINGRLITQVYGGMDDFQMVDQSRINGRLRRTTINGDSQTVMQDESIVTGLVWASTIDGASHVEFVEDSFAGRFRGSGFELRRNEVYVIRESGPLKADVYIPNTEGPHPAVLAIHGGGWRAGSKAGMSRPARAIADRGYVVVNINYRLAPGSQYPSQIHDAKAALVWMREHANELQIDPDRIATYGFSAGGHLALLLGVTDGSEPGSAVLEDPESNPTISTKVQAAIGVGPAVDFRSLPPDSKRFDHFFGGTPAEVPEAYTLASPAHWVSADDPPTIILVGEFDRIIFPDNLTAFIQDLDTQGVRAELYEATRTGHVGSIGDARTLRESLKFLDETLK